MVGLLAEIEIAIVRRDAHLPGIVVDLEIDAVAGLESEQLEVRVDDGHPRQVGQPRFGLSGVLRRIS